MDQETFPDQFSEGDNHGKEGGNIYQIDGKALWHTGPFLPKNIFVEGGNGEFPITLETTVSDMGNLTAVRLKNNEIR